MSNLHRKIIDRLIVRLIVRLFCSLFVFFLPFFSYSFYDYKFDLFFCCYFYYYYFLNKHFIVYHHHQFTFQHNLLLCFIAFIQTRVNVCFTFNIRISFSAPILLVNHQFPFSIQSIYNQYRSLIKKSKNAINWEALLHSNQDLEKNVIFSFAKYEK